jgi:large subunit ribosomal protein L9
MKVVLLDDIPKLGKMGDLIQTKDGYARNYLLPKGLAAPANPQNLKNIEHQKTLLTQKQNRVKRDAEKLAQRIEKVSCTISKPAGEEDKLFGSVTSLDIEESLNEEGLKIDRKKILLEEPIKSLGIYKVPIKLHPEVTANIKIWVVKA